MSASSRQFPRIVADHEMALHNAISAPDVDDIVPIVKWCAVVQTLIQMHGHNGPADQPHAYAFLRRVHASMPYATLLEASQALSGLNLPNDLILLTAPVNRRTDTETRKIVAQTSASSRLNLVSSNAEQLRADSSALSAIIPEVRPAEYARPTDADPAKPSRRDIRIIPFETVLRDEASVAFTLRRVPPEAMRTLISGSVRPTSGDIVLARVDRIRHQGRIELPTGRKVPLDEGSLIIAAYGDRYATDQFEAHVPMTLGPTNLIAVGGVVSEMLSKSSAVRGATEITPIGLVGNIRGEPLNLRNFALKPVAQPLNRPPVFAVLGTSMNSGKTTTIRFLLNGLSRARLAPGATKATGTGSGGDYWTMIDAGAHRMLDFTDVGYSSTFRIPTPLLERAAFELVDHLTVAGSGVILVEIADGLFHEQNRELIKTEFFETYVDGVIFAAGEALGASAGIAMLKDHGIPVIGVSGKMTASELMTREARKACGGVPVYTREDLRDPVTAAKIVGMSDVAPIDSRYSFGHLTGGNVYLSPTGARE